MKFKRINRINRINKFNQAAQKALEKELKKNPIPQDHISIFKHNEIYCTPISDRVRRLNKTWDR